MRRHKRFIGIAISIALLGSAVAAGAALPPPGTFVDDNGNLHEANIEAIAAAGITSGCAVSPARFCPTQPVTREQMAAFLVRTLSLGPADRDYFGDDTGSIFEDFINRLAASGITAGCGSATFCPNTNITREQMAAFLVRGYGYADAGTDRFTDDESSPFQADINRLAQAGITTGCASNRFCPLDPVLRDQMATFLARAEVLEPIPVEAGCSILPADNIWNARVDNLPVHSRSSQFISSIGISTTLHPDFGSGVWPPGSTSPIGIPYIEVPADQPPVDVV